MDKSFWIEHLKVYGQFLVLIAITFIIVALLKRLFNRMIKHSTEFMQNDPTSYQFLKHLIVGLVYVIGFGMALYTLPSFKTVAGTLLTGAGVIAVAAGFASQHALSNIISGLFIVIFKPFRVNDRLTIGTISGVVEDITLRHVVIRDFHNRRVVIPNTVISNDIIVNADYKDERICRWIQVGVGYDANIDQAKEIIRNIVMAHPLLIDGRSQEQIERNDPIVQVRVLSLGASSVDLRAWAWAKEVSDAFVLECDVYEQILKAFGEAGIDIPYSSHNLYIKEDKRID